MVAVFVGVGLGSLRGGVVRVVIVPGRNVRVMAGFVVIPRVVRNLMWSCPPVEAFM